MLVNGSDQFNRVGFTNEAEFEGVVQQYAELLEYTPRGGALKRFDGVLREDGVEFDGQVAALSAAALRCLRQANPMARAANGWKFWRLNSGERLSDVYARLTERPNEPDA